MSIRFNVSFELNLINLVVLTWLAPHNTNPVRLLSFILIKIGIWHSGQKLSLSYFIIVEMKKNVETFRKQHRRFPVKSISVGNGALIKNVYLPREHIQ